MVYPGCNVQHDKYNSYGCMLYMNIVKRVNPKSSHHKNLFSISLILVLIGDDGCSLNVL